MSGKICGLVWDYDLPHNEAWVLMAVADHADHSGRNAFPGVQLLAWKTGYEERQVRRILKRLEARGALIPQNRGRAGTVTTYTIDLLTLTLKRKQQDKKSGSQADKKSGSQADKKSGSKISTGGHLGTPEPDILTTANRTFRPDEPDISGDRSLLSHEPSMNRPLINRHEPSGDGSDLITTEGFRWTLEDSDDGRFFSRPLLEAYSRLTGNRLAPGDREAAEALAGAGFSSRAVVSLMSEIKTRSTGRIGSIHYFRTALEELAERCERAERGSLPSMVGAGEREKIAAVDRAVRREVEAWKNNGRKA